MGLKAFMPSYAGKLTSYNSYDYQGSPLASE
jgi:hypothetical protein